MISLLFLAASITAAPYVVEISYANSISCSGLPSKVLIYPDTDVYRTDIYRTITNSISLSECGFDPVPQARGCCATNYNGIATEKTSWNIYQIEYENNLDISSLIPSQATSGYCVVDSSTSDTYKALYPANGECTNTIRCMNEAIVIFDYSDCKGNSAVTSLSNGTKSIGVYGNGTTVSFQSFQGAFDYTWTTTITVNKAYPIPLMDTANDIISSILILFSIVSSLGTYFVHLIGKITSNPINAVLTNVIILWLFYSISSAAIWFNLFQSEGSLNREIVQNVAYFTYNVASCRHTIIALANLGRYKQFTVKSWYLYLFALIHAVAAIPTYFSILGYFIPSAKAFFQSFKILWNCIDSVLNSFIPFYISTSLTLDQIDGKSGTSRYQNRLSLLSYFLTANTILLLICFGFLSGDRMLDDRRWLAMACGIVPFCNTMCGLLTLYSNKATKLLLNGFENSAEKEKKSMNEKEGGLVVGLGVPVTTLPTSPDAGSPFSATSNAPLVQGMVSPESPNLPAPVEQDKDSDSEEGEAVLELRVNLNDENPDGSNFRAKHQKQDSQFTIRPVSQKPPPITDRVVIPYPREIPEEAFLAQGSFVDGNMMGSVRPGDLPMVMVEETHELTPIRRRSSLREEVRDEVAVLPFDGKPEMTRDVNVPVEHDADTGAKLGEIVPSDNQQTTGDNENIMLPPSAKSSHSNLARVQPVAGLVPSISAQFQTDNFTEPNFVDGIVNSVSVKSDIKSLSKSDEAPTVAVQQGVVDVLDMAEDSMSSSKVLQNLVDVEPPNLNAVEPLLDSKTNTPIVPRSVTQTQTGLHREIQSGIQTEIPNEFQSGIQTQPQIETQNQTQAEIQNETQTFPKTHSKPLSQDLLFQEDPLTLTPDLKVRKTIKKSGTLKIPGPPPSDLSRPGTLKKNVTVKVPPPPSGLSGVVTAPVLKKSEREEDKDGN